MNDRTSIVRVTNIQLIGLTIYLFSYIKNIDSTNN